jgi:diacylglycerol kinase family enzyme
VAVLLNVNARQVTDRVVRALSHVVAERDLFLSHSAAEGKAFAAQMLDCGYQTVFCGGGDGTFMALVNDVLEHLERQRGPLRPPQFGLLKLGTGNGLASMVRASSAKDDRFVEDVLRAKAGEVPGHRNLDLLRVNGLRAVFAGLGVDGKVLNDYVWVKQHLARGPLRRSMTGPRGYFTSVALKTLPYYLTHSTCTECEVTNGRFPAYRLGPDGQPMGAPIAPGDLVFRGRLNFAAAATIPFYGFGFRMFPFAGQRPGMMQLRLARVSPLQAVANLPRLWKGEYFSKDIHDFHIAEATVRFARPMPLQIGGDAEGYREVLTFDMAPEQIEILDFTAPEGASLPLN